MSSEEADKTAAADASAGDEEEEWLYGDEGESKENEEEEAKLTAAIGGSTPTAPPDSEEVTANSVTPPTTTGNGVESQVSSQTPEETPGEDEDSESDSDDDDDDVRVTIGDIKTGAPQYTAYAAPVNLNIKTTGRAYGAVGTKGKGVDLEAPGSINGVPVLEVDMETFEEKPWRKPGADLSDYFNYGFNEETWKAYCEKQKKLRMGLDNLTMGSTTSKISVQQGRTGNTEKEITIQAHTSQADFSPSTMYKTGLNQVRMSPPRWQGPVGQEMPYYTKTSGTIDVIGGQTATISRVEGRRRHNLEGNNIQVISDHSTSEAEPAVAKMPPPFFPPGPLPPNMPPPPFLPPPVSQAPPLIPPPRIPITVPPPNFPPPTGGPPPSLIPTLDNGHPGGYDGRPVPPFPFPPGGFPPPMQGAVNPWPGMMDNSKPWDYYPRREKEREKERERDRPRERVHDRDHSPSSVAYNRTIVGASSGEQSSLKPTFSDEERYRYRDYGDRGYERHRERASREKEERHRERRHREKEEGRHKSSRSSSRRRHDSEEGDSHRRHKHKKSKRSKEGKEPSEERSGDQENQEAME